MTEKTNNRIARLRTRYLDEAPRISVERAQFFTQSWRRAENENLSRGMRVALAMKNVYENMTHFVEPNDLIAGYWTESFMGIPIDIERGVFNTVFRTELARSSIVKFRIKSMGGTLSYLVEKKSLIDFIRNIKSTRSAGPQPMNLEVQTMTEREVNRYSITARDRKILLTELLPYWDGKTVVDVLDKEILASGLLGDDMRDFNLALPANTSRQTMMISICSTISTYQAHVILDYEKILRQGLLAMHAEAVAAAAADGLSEEQRDFLKSIG